MSEGTTDRSIRVATTVSVSVVAVIAAIVSYSHIRSVALAHNQTPVDATLLPFSVDGLIAAASLCLLFASRNKVQSTALARAMLILGVGVTVGVNAIYGSHGGTLATIISAWPAIAFIGAAELLIWLVRNVAVLNSGKPKMELWSNPKQTQDELIRSWAADKGMPVKKRIPRDVSRQYHAAMSGQNGNGA